MAVTSNFKSSLHAELIIGYFGDVCEKFIVYDPAGGREAALRIVCFSDLSDYYGPFFLTKPRTEQESGQALFNLQPVDEDRTLELFEEFLEQLNLDVFDVDLDFLSPLLVQDDSSQERQLIANFLTEENPQALGERLTISAWLPVRSYNWRNERPSLGSVAYQTLKRRFLFYRNRLVGLADVKERDGKLSVVRLTTGDIINDLIDGLRRIRSSDIEGPVRLHEWEGLRLSLLSNDDVLASTSNVLPLGPAAWSLSWGAVSFMGDARKKVLPLGQINKMGNLHGLIKALARERSFDYY